MVNLMVYQNETYRVHELVRDTIMIGRAPSNHIVIDNPRSVSAARHSSKSRGLLSTQGFEFNERDANQWCLCQRRRFEG